MWLSLFAAVWLLAQPSCRREETLTQASRRVRRAILGDGLFWLGVVVIGYFLTLVFKDGASLSYEPVQGVWQLREPVGSGLQGAVAGSGALPLATVVGLVVTMQGVSHALGRRARRAFLLVGSSLSAIGVFVLLAVVRWGGFDNLLSVDYASPYFFGVAFGWWAVAGLVALFLAVREEWWTGASVAGVVTLVNVGGLALFAPVPEILCFEAALLLLALAALGVSRQRFSARGLTACLVVTGLVLALPFWALGLGRSQVAVAAKFQALVRFELWPDAVVALRSQLSDLSSRIWHEARPYGIGLGAFPTCLRVFATSADWAVIRPWQTAATNGWWQLLLEHGWTGAVWFGAFALWPLGAWVRRIVTQYGALHWGAVQILMPVAFLLGLVTMGLSATGTRADVLLVFFPLLALSEGAIPRRRE